MLDICKCTKNIVCCWVALRIPIKVGDFVNFVWRVSRFHHRYHRCSQNGEFCCYRRSFPRAMDEEDGAGTAIGHRNGNEIVRSEIECRNFTGTEKRNSATLRSLEQTVTGALLELVVFCLADSPRFHFTTLNLTVSTDRNSKRTIYSHSKKLFFVRHLNNSFA